MTQGQDSRSAPGKVLVRVVIVGWQLAEHALEGLGSSLDACQELLPTSFRGLDDGRHSLERRRELEPSLDIDLSGKLGFLVLGSDLISLGEFPVERVERGSFHGISDDGPVVQEDERVSGSEREDRIFTAIGDGDELLGVLGIYTGDTLDDEVFPRDRPGLVETTDIDLAGERDSERFGTEDG